MFNLALRVACERKKKVKKESRSRKIKKEKKILDSKRKQTYLEVDLVDYAKSFFGQSLGNKVRI
jgi:hypothetical protein